MIIEPNPLVSERVNDLYQFVNGRDIFSSPGSAYLKVLDYFYEEKKFTKYGHNIDTWEKFISKHFSNDGHMLIKVNHGYGSYDISNIDFIF